MHAGAEVRRAGRYFPAPGTQDQHRIRPEIRSHVQHDSPGKKKASKRTTRKRPQGARTREAATSPEVAAVWVDVSTLKPWPQNPRKGQPVAEVANLIERYGFAAPIVARKVGRQIIAGHTRLKAAQKLGLEKMTPSAAFLRTDSTRCLPLSFLFGTYLQDVSDE